MSTQALLVPSLVATLLGLSALVACSDDATSGSSSGTGSPSQSDAGPDARGTEVGDRDGGANGDRDNDAGDGGPVDYRSCLPAFHGACRPPITFVNKEPEYRGKIFTDAVPNLEAAEQEIACTACSMLYRQPSEIPSDKHPNTISIVLVNSLPGGHAAQAGGETIEISLAHIGSWKDDPAELIEQEMLGVLLHETVHLYQNYGNAGTGEGVADLVRAQVGYYEPYRWQAGEGTWRDAYTASGNFYSWLTGPSPFHAAFYPGHDRDFPYKLNKALAGKSGEDAYTAVSSLIDATFGKDVDTLWDEYQDTAF